MTTSEKLEKAIAMLKEQHRELSKNLYLEGNIPDKVLERHTKWYAPIGSDEKVLFVVNYKIPGTAGKYGWTGMLVTDKAVYYRCLKNSFFSSLVAIAQTGIIPLSEIESMAIGDHDICFGTAYTGHKLLVNGQVKGLLRMGGGMEYDEKLIDELTQIFNDLTEK